MGIPLRPRRLRSKITGPLVAVTAAAAVAVSAATVALAAVVTGNAGDNTLRGTDQADRIDGRAGDDTLLARKGSDRLTGGRDDDRLNGGQTGAERYLFDDNWGNDTIADPAGRDGLNFSAASFGVVVDLVPSADNEARTTNDAGSGTVNFPSTVAIEDVVGTADEDTIRGTDTGNSLAGGADNDFLEGRGGNDTLGGGGGFDEYVFDEGWGADTVLAGSQDLLNFHAVGVSIIVDLETAGAEVFAGPDTVDLESPQTARFTYGGGVGDVLRGSDSGEQLQGGPVFASGNDVLEGRGGNDTVDGADGDDTYVFDDGWGIDIISTEPGGNDTLRFSAVSQALTVDLVEDNETSEVTSGADVVNWFAGREVENVVAGDGADSITGNEFANNIEGRGGQDTVSSAAGNDTVDVSDGSGGEDVDCGADADTVYLDSIRNPFGPGRLATDNQTNCETRHLE
jgi:Ca2+-binding RTX toxin-like protein